MKLLEYVSLQKFTNYYDEEVKNKTMEEQIHQLQNQVDLMLKSLKRSQLIPIEDLKEV